jgi:hypothetical protein
MRNSKTHAARTAWTALAALILASALAGCGAGGAIEDALNPPAKPQGLRVQCDPTSAVFLYSIDIVGMGQTSNIIVNLPPGQQTLVTLGQGVYTMTTWWEINGFYMQDPTPYHFTVPKEQVAHVMVK